METFADYGIKVSGSGQQYTTCPQCSHTRSKPHDKCLSVDVDNGVWKCHHCGWCGGLKSERKYTPAPKPKVYRKPEYKPGGLDQVVIDFFTKRKIPVEVLQRNKITGTVKGIKFPYFHDGVVVNVKTRLPKKDFRLEKDAKLIPYGMDDVLAEETIFVEGEMDKLAIEACGVKNCIAAPSALPPETKNYNLAWLDGVDLSRVERWVLAGDMDDPGRRLMAELARRFGKGKCWLVSWPDGCKDANDTLIKHGKDKVLELLCKAEEIRTEGVFKPSDSISDLLVLYREGIAKGLSIGFQSLADKFSIMGGQWTVITGTPGSGKSLFLDAIILNTIKLHGLKWAVCSMENQPKHFHFMNLVSMLNGMPFLEGYNTRLSEADLQASIDYLDGFMSVILPADNLTLKSILAKAEDEIHRRGINALVIDPWNELDHQIPKNESETQYISRSLSIIRRFARKHNIHIFVVAHPTKIPKISTGGTSKFQVPTPYDISGSAHWYNKADNAICVYRATPQDVGVEIYVQKIRFQAQIGKPGMARMIYNPITKRYDDGGPCPL